MNGTSGPQPPGPGNGGDLAPAELLREVQGLRDRTSVAGRAYWLPLLIFGAIICGSVPFYQRIGNHVPPALNALAEECAQIATLPHGSCQISVQVITPLGYYWQIVFPVGVILTVLWYRWRGNRIGVRTPAISFLVIGLVLAELILIVPALASRSGSMAQLMQHLHHSIPLVLIAVALWVLAWAERSPALAVITISYLVVALVVSVFTGNGVAGGSTGADASLSLTDMRLLGLLPALVLLVSGAGVWLVQRRRHRRAAAAS
jgi:hypothetical protein